jgi:hypothetical protein
MSGIAAITMRSAGCRGTAALMAAAGITTLGGCGAGADEPFAGAGAFEQWDSAGVHIAQSSGDVLQRPLPWVIDSVPDLEIGTVDGEEPYQFTRITSVVAGRDGEIIVLDGERLDVRWFDARGTFLRAAGGAGQGPGEFARAQLVRQFQPDSLLLYDVLQRRFTSLSIDGEEVRTLASGGAPQRSLLAGRPSVANGGRVLIHAGGGECSPLEDGVCEERLFLHAVDANAGTSDTLAVSTRRLFQTSEFGGIPLVLTIPYDAEASAAADDQGFLLSTGDAFEIRGFGGDGALERILRLDHPPPILEEEELEETIQTFPRGQSPLEDVRRMFGQMEIRSTKPAFQSLRVDPLGWIWAERFRFDEAMPGEWVVFDPSGQAHGVVSVPGGLEVHDIGEDYILGVATDALRVQVVRRHPLERARSR